MKLSREGEIVFDGIGRTHDLGVLAADDSLDHTDLDFVGKAG